MGVTVFRWLARRNETDIFPAIPPNWGQMSAWKPSQAQETVWPGLRPRRPIYLTPYVLSGFDRTYELNDDGDRLRPGRLAEVRAGPRLQVRPDRQPDLRRDRSTRISPRSRPTTSRST